MPVQRREILALLDEFKRLEIEAQIDYQKFYLYSIITHSTAIEGSTVTEIENRLLFDEGISASGRSMMEQFMNLDLKAAYEQSLKYAQTKEPVTEKLLCGLSAKVMKNTGAQYKTPVGDFDASRGDLRLLNVSAGIQGSSYLNYQKVPGKLKEFCDWLNAERNDIGADKIDAYDLSFRAHFRLVSIHPWADGNGRMSRLLMNQLQWENGLIPTIVYKEHKANYIESLRRAREEENEDVFCDFMFSELRYFLIQSINNFKKGNQQDVHVNVHVNVRVNVHVNLSSRQREILKRLRENPSCTLAELASRLNVNEKTVRRDMTVLRQQGFVLREGSDKKGLWRVVAEEEANPLSRFD